ncbi:MAG: type I-E CRISPR-associated endoribonuclease Cas2e [Candidatus Kapaibacterium sp.]
MTIFIYKKVPASLRGEISRWMLEVSTGVFIGRISRLVREELWTKSVEKCKDGSITLIWKTNTEQGFDIMSWNNKDYIPTEMEGLKLILRPSETA